LAGIEAIRRMGWAIFDWDAAQKLAELAETKLETRENRSIGPQNVRSRSTAT